MITTARAIIKRSLRLIAATASGEDPTADEFTDCFDALQTMAEAWDIEKLMSTTDNISQVSVLAGASSFTLGPTADYVTDLVPTFLSYAYIDAPGISYEIDIAETRKEFDDEVQSSPSGWPSKAFYTKHDPASDETIFQMSSALPDSATIKFGTSSRNSLFVTLDGNVDLPAGLKRAFEYNLSIEVAPEFQAQPSQLVMQIASESKAMLKLHNFSVGTLSMPDAIGLLGQEGFNIGSGE